VKLSRAAIALYMALVFASGATLGVYGNRYYATVNTVTKGNKGKGKGRMSPEEYRRNYVQFMEHRLKLSPDQVTKLGQYFDDTQRAMDELMHSTVPEQQALRQQQTDKTRSMLNDDQKLEYEKMLKERDEFMKNKGKNKGQRPGGPGMP